MLLLLGGCSVSKTPDFIVCSKETGIAFIDEQQFVLDIDFTKQDPVIKVNNSLNSFDTIYTFGEKGVEIKYDNISSLLSYSRIPDKNIAYLTYRIVEALNSENEANWEKNGELWYFSGKINEATFKGICEENGKITSFEIPEYKIYFKKSV